ncbi:MAG: PKD domain-containing protein, partial [Saprospiraceae bacterium]|nr:PKD domain-containing protein [Saprospiraceae bacterium]
SCSDPTLFSPNPSSTAGTQWSWTFSDKSSSTAKNPVYKWVTPDTTGYSLYGMYLDTIFLTIGNPSGCTDSYLVVDTIWRPNARFIPNRQHGCAPLEVIFADSSKSNEPIVEWTWLFDDGTAPLINNNNSPATHTFTQPGEYEVQLVIRNSAGCIDSSYTILIEVGEPITGDFIADKFSVCPGDTVQFTNLTTDPRVDAWHFSSDSDRLWHCFQDQNPIWSYQSETGPMDVSLTTEYNGCMFTVTKPEYIQAKGPIAQLHYKTTCDNTLEFAFTNESHDATSVKWYLGDGDSTLQNNFVHTYAMPGTYTVVLKAENPSSGCPISYDTATVYPTILKAEFDLPDTICGGEKQILDGAKSLGVNAACYKGYTWYFSFQRPIRTDQAQTEFTFGPSGPQTVSLEVEDINGCKDTLTDDIVIYNRYPGFTISDEQICIPSSVTFTDNSTADATIVSYEWDFGDGSMSTDKSPTHIYTTPPPNGLPYFNVVLRIEDDKGCPAYVNGLVFVYKPTSNILTFPQPAQICAGESVSFSATNYTAGGSSLNWQWTFGNGNTATGQGSQQVYPNGGEFPVKMVYTEIATGCKDSTFANVSVQAPPTASFTTDVDTLGILCYPKNITFTNTSTSPYPLGNPFWDLDNGITTTSNMPSTVFPKGTYTVTLIASTTYGCTSSTTASYTVVGPEGNFTKDKTTICKGDEITFMLTSDTASISSWAWSFGDGTTQEGGDPVKHKYDFLPPSGATTVKLVLRGENDACTIVKEQDIFFSLVAADFQVPPTICAGGDATFLNTSTSADLSAWTFGDGGNSSDVSPSHVYLAEGTYTVSLTVTDQPLGCVDTKTQNITVTGLPNLVVQGDTICPGDTAMLSVLTSFNNATYVWSPANLILQPKDESAVMAIPTQTTDFIVTVIDGSGCTDQATAQVFIPPVFGGAADFDTIVAANSTVILPIVIDPVYTFTWSPLPAPTGNPLSVTVADSSMHYILTVRDKFGCTDREFKIDILVVPENVLAPNAFTPNNDDANDVFSLITQQGEEELVEVLSLRVFNRWGQKVFEGSGSLTDVGWDGKTDGKEAPSDVYVYVAEVRFATGRIATLKGDVVLLR